VSYDDSWFDDEAQDLFVSALAASRRPRHRLRSAQCLSLARLVEGAGAHFDETEEAHIGTCAYCTMTVQMARDAVAADAADAADTSGAWEELRDGTRRLTARLKAAVAGAKVTFWDLPMLPGLQLVAAPLTLGPPDEPQGGPPFEPPGVLASALRLSMPDASLVVELRVWVARTAGATLSVLLRAETDGDATFQLNDADGRPLVVVAGRLPFAKDFPLDEASMTLLVNYRLDGHATPTRTVIDLSVDDGLGQD
jgi:hypothetical protein